MTPSSSLIHQRVGTLCKAYMKKFNPDIYNVLVRKAEEEYANRQYRRTTEDDLDIALAKWKNPSI